jgi:hypothetical protein
MTLLRVMGMRGHLNQEKRSQLKALWSKQSNDKIDGE